MSYNKEMASILIHYQDVILEVFNRRTKDFVFEERDKPINKILELVIGELDRRFSEERYKGLSYPKDKLIIIFNKYYLESKSYFIGDISRRASLYDGEIELNRRDQPLAINSEAFSLELNNHLSNLQTSYCGTPTNNKEEVFYRFVEKVFNAMKTELNRENDQKDGYEACKKDMYNIIKKSLLNHTMSHLEEISSEINSSIEELLSTMSPDKGYSLTKSIDGISGSATNDEVISDGLPTYGVFK